MIICCTVRCVGCTGSTSTRNDPSHGTRASACAQGFAKSQARAPALCFNPLASKVSLLCVGSMPWADLPELEFCELRVAWKCPACETPCPGAQSFDGALIQLPCGKKEARVHWYDVPICARQACDGDEPMMVSTHHYCLDTSDNRILPSPALRIVSSVRRRSLAPAPKRSATSTGGLCDESHLELGFVGVRRSGKATGQYDRSTVDGYASGRSGPRTVDCGVHRFRPM